MRQFSEVANVCFVIFSVYNKEKEKEEKENKKNKKKVESLIYNGQNTIPLWVRMWRQLKSW